MEPKRRQDGKKKTRLKPHENDDNNFDWKEELEKRKEEELEEELEKLRKEELEDK